MPPPQIDTEAIRVLVEETDWTIERLADRMGVDRVTLSRWLHGSRGERVPRRRQAQLILHLEAHDIPLFDKDGVALPVGGTP